MSPNRIRKLNQKNEKPIEPDFQNSLSENPEPAEVKSTQRITQILLSFGTHGASLAEIVEKTKLRKTTVHRLLKALSKENMVINDALSHRYYLGPTITHLIWEPQITQAYLIQSAKREMENLATFTEETIVLGILIGTNHNLIYSIQSPNELRVVPPNRPNNRLYAGAANKVLLSQLNETDLERTLNLLVFEPITLSTLTTREDLIKDIQLIRQYGYGISTSEAATGATCYAVPVPGYGKPIVLGILGPEPRMKPRSSVFIDKLISSAVQISRNFSANKSS